MIEITSTSIATHRGMRDLVTATTTLIATISLDKECIKPRDSSRGANRLKRLFIAEISAWRSLLRRRQACENLKLQIDP